MTSGIPYEAKVYEIFQHRPIAHDKECSKFSRQYKLGLRHLKYAYERLYHELVRYSETGYKEYLQVVWKNKILRLCEVLQIDQPKWLPHSILGQLSNFRIIFSDRSSTIPILFQEDRFTLVELVSAVLINWDSYIESVRPSNEQEIILCMTFEETSMKEVYKEQLYCLGMTSFSKTNDGSFHVIGKSSPEAFYTSFQKLLWKKFRIQVTNIQSIVRYTLGSQSSLTSLDI